MNTKLRCSSIEYVVLSHSLSLFHSIVSQLIGNAHKKRCLVCILLLTNYCRWNAEGTCVRKLSTEIYVLHLHNFHSEYKKFSFPRRSTTIFLCLLTICTTHRDAIQLNEATAQSLHGFYCWQSDLQCSEDATVCFITSAKQPPLYPRTFFVVVVCALAPVVVVVVVVGCVFFVFFR